MADRITGRERTQAGLDSWRGALQRVALILLVLILLGGVWIGGDGWTAIASSDLSARLQLGRITSIERDALFITLMRATQVAIGAQRYALDPQVMITEENGRVRDQTFLKPGVWMKFHLKRQLIDQIVLIRPK
jgi:hypothetical protein